MSIVINRFLNNAGGCPRRDWPRRSRLWNDALPSGAILLSYEFFPAEIAQTSPNVFDIRAWPQVALLSFALMFPVALISGIIFPLIVARVQTSVGDRMNSKQPAEGGWNRYFLASS
ncbi:MAG: hypothetical protein DME44_01890 [Verrucomicrobia bacterium]|nr:MAG: hypothetical protein DME44_01890 [Verrucomicrobiota bacterium]